MLAHAAMAVTRQGSAGECAFGFMVILVETNRFLETCFGSESQRHLNIVSAGSWRPEGAGTNSRAVRANDSHSNAPIKRPLSSVVNSQSKIK